MEDEAMTTTMTNPTPAGNGSARPARKSLAHEIDRLDQMLEGLSDSLNESVAAAVQGAVRQAVALAVEAAVKEVLTSPELLDRLRAAAAPALAPAKPIPAGPGVFGRMAATLNKWARDGWAYATALAGDARAVAKACCAELKARAEAAWAWARTVTWLVLCLLYAARRPLLVAAAVGVTVAVGAYLAGPLVASLVSGLGGMATTLGTLGLLPLRRYVLPGDALADRA
jgi:hypothetical protein